MIKIGKAFEIKKSEKKAIKFFAYNPKQDTDYYSFVRSKCKLNYHQVIITSAMMIDILDYYFLERHASIYSIELMESDENFEQEIQDILLKMDKDRAYYSKLISLLKFIKEESSIDLKKIRLKNKGQNDQFCLFVQVNGLVGADQVVFDRELEKIGHILERQINI